MTLSLTKELIFLSRSFVGSSKIRKLPGLIRFLANNNQLASPPDKVPTLVLSNLGSNMNCFLNKQ
jgi:hypothetical protein